MRQWLERIVATLPEPRQRMYDLFVTRGLDSRNAALELAATVAEVRRLRRENRQAILRAFEVTALAAAEAAVDPPSIGAPGCGELRQILAAARSDDGDPQEGPAPHGALPAALRLTLSRHLSQCRACQDRRDDCMARWAPELLPILADAELHEQVMADLQSMPELRQPGAGPGAHRRVAPAGPASKVVIGRAAAAAGTGLLAALLLLAFVWPGVLLGTRAATDVSSPDRNKAVTSGADAPKATDTVDGVPDDNHGRPARPRATGLSEQSSAGGCRELGRILVRVGAAIRVLHRSAFNCANVVPHAAASTPSPSPSSSGSRTTSPTPSPSTSTPTPSQSSRRRVYRHADADRIYLDADAYPERVCLHADTHDERVHAHADAERVCLGADAHRFGVSLVTDFGSAHGVVVDGSAVGVSHDCLSHDRPQPRPVARLPQRRRPRPKQLHVRTSATCGADAGAAPGPGPAPGPG